MPTLAQRNSLLLKLVAVMARTTESSRPDVVVRQRAKARLTPFPSLNSLLTMRVSECSSG
jgi:hypothetical protein